MPLSSIQIFLFSLFLRPFHTPWMQTLILPYPLPTMKSEVCGLSIERLSNNYAHLHPQISREPQCIQRTISSLDASIFLCILSNITFSLIKNKYIPIPLGV